MGDQVTLHRLGSVLSGMFHFVARGAQPLIIVLKIDGDIVGPWASVFIPSWGLLFVITVAGSVLCCCAPVLSRGVLPEVRSLLMRMMVLCSIVTFSLAVCALLFLVFLTLHLDDERSIPPGTILAPLITLYGLMLVFLPLLLLSSRRYHQAMTTAQEEFQQANDPSGGGGGGGGGAGGQGGRARSGSGAGVGLGPPILMGVVTAPTILMRESSTLFRRASASFCRRLGEADGALLETDIISVQVWGRVVPREGQCEARTSGKAEVVEHFSIAGTSALPPPLHSRSYPGVVAFLPQPVAAPGLRGGIVRGQVALGGTAAVSGTGSSWEVRKGSATRCARQDAFVRPLHHLHPQEERYDRGLLQGGVLTDSITDSHSYDYESFGSTGQEEEEEEEDEEHEIGLSIDGDEKGFRDGPFAGVDNPPSPLMSFTSLHSSTHPNRGEQSNAGGWGAGVGAGAMTMAGAGAEGGSSATGSTHSERACWGAGAGAGAGAGVAAGAGFADMGHSLGPADDKISAPAAGHRVFSTGKAGAGAGDWAGDGTGAGAGAGAGGAEQKESPESGGGMPVSGPGLPVLPVSVPDLRLSSPGPSSTSPTQCFICCEHSADAVIMECGHGGMCFSCAQHLASTRPPQCPVCREPISEVLRFGKIMAVHSSEGG
ncbi:unnamed protein product, partial [Discosporangium mesarthrocarpum]